MEDEKNLFLFLAAGSVNLLAFANGNAYAWTSPVFPKINTNDSSLNPLEKPTTATEDSWVGALLDLGAAIGPFVAGFSADFFGRKKTLLALAFPMLASHLLSAFATKVYFYYIARFLMGLSAGSVYSVVPMYVGEIAKDNNRGLVGCLLSVLQSLGMLFVYSVGPYVSIQLLNFLCLVPLVLFLATFIFMPESPYYLAAIQDKEGMERSLMKIRKQTSEQVQKELQAITQHVEDSKKNKGSLKDIYKQKGCLKAFYIGNCIAIMQQLSGITIVLLYMQPIFDASGSTIPSDISVIVVALIQFIVTCLTSKLIDKIGRKILLLMSCAVTFFAVSSLGAYFYLQNIGVDVEPIFWLPVTSLVVFMISFSLGLGPVCWAILGEIFPPNIKAIACTVATSANLFAGFVISVLFPQFQILFGIAGTFWFFAASLVFAMIFIAIFVPETKGKSLQDITLLFTK